MSEEKLIIHPKRPKGDDGHKTFSIRIKDDLFMQLEALAEHTDRSRNELISILLRYALEHCEIAESTGNSGDNPTR
ncbi:MAG: CopG family transcriptional regulator [Lachnospiraceae bacterium]|jgi:predicted transcriptional regulator|nr:CopG family transcriptional regulator [Lachnospiraceae bacterium]